MSEGVPPKVVGLDGKEVVELTNKTSPRVFSLIDTFREFCEEHNVTGAALVATTDEIEGIHIYDLQPGKSAIPLMGLLHHTLARVNKFYDDPETSKR